MNWLWFIDNIEMKGVENWDWLNIFIIFIKFFYNLIEFIVGIFGFKNVLLDIILILEDGEIELVFIRNKMIFIFILSCLVYYFFYIYRGIFKGLII